MFGMPFSAPEVHALGDDPPPTLLASPVRIENPYFAVVLHEAVRHTPIWCPGGSPHEQNLELEKRGEPPISHHKLFMVSSILREMADPSSRGPTSMSQVIIPLGEENMNELFVSLKVSGTSDSWFQQ